MISLYKLNGEKQAIEYKPKAASEAFAFNDLVGISTTGYLTKYLSGSAFPVYGLIQKTIAATDADFALATRVPVLVVGPEAEYLLEVSTGTPAAGDVGEYVDVEDSNSVTLDGSSHNDFYVTEIISSTYVLGKLTQKVGNVIES